MEYNSQREKLIIPEYGRNIQKLVELTTQIPQKEERTKMAEQIIETMFALLPNLKDSEENKHKLWDHLHIISDFKLDIDAPYPPPQIEDIKAKPQKLNYPSFNIKYKHYGHNINLLIDKAIATEDPYQKNELVKSIANQMKRLYLTWNREYVEDELIMENLKELSKGKLSVDQSFQFERIKENNNNLISNSSFKPKKTLQKRKFTFKSKFKK